MDEQKRKLLLVGIGTVLLGVALFFFINPGKKDPRYKNPKLSGVYDYIDSGTYDRAIPRLRLLRTQFPDDAEVFYTSALVLYKLHRYRQCLIMAEETVAKAPAMAEAQAILGAAYFKSLRFDRALDASREALKLNPQLALPFFVIGSVYVRQEKVEEGIKLLQESIRLNPDNANFWTGLSSAHLKRKNLQEALAASEKALELDPSLGPAHFNMGLVYFHLEKPEKALEHLQKVEEVYVDKRDKGWISQARYTRNLIKKKYNIQTGAAND